MSRSLTSSRPGLSKASPCTSIKAAWIGIQSAHCSATEATSQIDGLLWRFAATC